MVEAWGNVLTIIGNTLSVCTEIILFDSFFPRKKSGKTYWLFVAVGILAISSFSFFIGSSGGYTLKILFEVAFYYILCAILCISDLQCITVQQHFKRYVNLGSNRRYR